MSKDSKPDKEENNGKDRDFNKFIKKRGPLYIVLSAVFLIFLIPELTQNDLESVISSDLSENGKHAVELVKSYNGPNEKGLEMFDAISDQINKEYSDEKIFDHKDTVVDLFATEKSDEMGENVYEVKLLVKTYKENREFIWNANIESNEISAISVDAKRIQDIVDYYD